MKRSETALALAKIAAVDNRRLDPPDADLSDPMATPILSAWHELIGHLNVRDVLQAIHRHRQATPEWIQPAHVIRLVEQIRNERLAGVTSEAIAEALGIDGDDPRYLEKIQAHYAQIANGVQAAPPRALEAGR